MLSDLHSPLSLPQQVLSPLSFNLSLTRPGLQIQAPQLICLTMHRHFTVSIKLDTLHFIRDGQTVFEAKTLTSNAAYLVGNIIPVGEFASLSSTATLPMDLTLLHRRLCHHHSAGIRKLLSGNLVTLDSSLIQKLSLIRYVKPAKLVRCMQIHSLSRPLEPPDPFSLCTAMCMAL